MPVLAAGAAGWWTMQHRSPDGAFQADLAPIFTGNHVVVVPDVDAVLRRDAPFARADQTELRLTAGTDTFVGMALPADLAAYLAGVDYTEISGVSLGRGPLAVQTRTITATGEPLAPPSAQPFWVRSGTGDLRWTPATDRDRQLALIVIAPPGDTAVNLSVGLTAGWLNSTTWGLLILGPVLLLLGLAALAWPQRPREIVYVVDTPTATQAGLPLPAPRSFPLALPASSAPSVSPAPAPEAVTPSSPTASGVRGASGVPVAGGMPPASAYFATPVSCGASVPLPTQSSPLSQLSPPELSWPPAESPTTTEPAREIPTQELPLIDPEHPMPTAGVQLHLTKPQ